MSSHPRYTRIHAVDTIPLQYIRQNANDEQNVVSVDNGAPGPTNGETAEDHEIVALAHEDTRQYGEMSIARFEERSRMPSAHFLRQNTTGSPLRNSSSVIPTTPGFLDIDLSHGSESRSYRAGGSISSVTNETLHQNLRSSAESSLGVSYDNHSRVRLRQGDEDISQSVQQPPLARQRKTRMYGARNHWADISIHMLQTLKNSFQEVAARVMGPKHMRRTSQTRLTDPRMNAPRTVSFGDMAEVLEVRSAVPADETNELMEVRESQQSRSELPAEQHSAALPMINVARSAHEMSRKVFLGIVTLMAAEQLTFILIVVQACIIVTETFLGFTTQGRSLVGPCHWTTSTLLVIFTVFTVEICVKVVLSGFMFNRDERSLSDRIFAHWVANVSWSKGSTRLSNQVMPSSAPAVPSTETKSPFLPHVLYRLHAAEDAPDCPALTEDPIVTEKAFLRRPGGFMDLVAVLSFWLDIMFGSLETESTGKLGLLRALSCLRMMRLLNCTKGTLAITRHIRRIAPMLLLVGLLVVFCCLLFAIAGVHSFGLSLSRRCVWDGSRADLPQSNTTSPRLCDSWWTMNGSEMITMPWLDVNGVPGVQTYGGYTCPLGSWCVEGDSLYRGISGFDSLWSSLVMVFVLLTGRSFTDTMYSLTESNGLAAVTYFMAGFVILRLWLINLVVATVVTASHFFGAVRMSDAVLDPASKLRPSAIKALSRPRKRLESVVDFFKKMRGLPVTVIAINMIVKSRLHDTMSSRTADLIWWSEVSTVLILDIEIVLRLLCISRPCRQSLQNWTDLMIAAITTILLVPAVHHSGKLYDWLSVMQVLRIYRVVWTFSVVRDLINPLVAHLPGLLTLMLYMIMSFLLVAMLATQLFWYRPSYADGNVYVELPIDFTTIHGALLGMYRATVSETWRDVLLEAIRYDTKWYSVCISVAFFFACFVFISLIILNMFIATVQNSFHLDDEQKHLQQVRRFLQQKEANDATATIYDFLKRYKKGSGRATFGSVPSDLMLRDSVMRDFLDDVDDSDDETSEPVEAAKSSTRSFGTDTIRFLVRLWGKSWASLFDLETNPFYAGLKFTKPVEDLAPSALAKEVVEITENQTIAQRQYLLSHPYYDSSLCLFAQGNKFRSICQRAVQPGRGHVRYQGVAPSPGLSLVFSIFGYMLIIAMVIIACFATPEYKKGYFYLHGFSRENWFVFAEVGFAALFTIEALVRVVADGFFWTPNAYLRSFWGVTDIIAITSMWINAILLLEVSQYGAQAIGALKALKVLRLLEIKEKTIQNYTSALISGKRPLLAIVCIASALLWAFAVWGLQLFSGRTYLCNEATSEMAALTDCVGEYFHVPDEWMLLVPRHIKTSNFPFGDFASSMLTLFRSASESTWLDEHAGTIFAQPKGSATIDLTLFFLIYKLLSGTLVITLLVSIVIQNYMEQTGAAFLTQEQRSWRELTKHLLQIRPYKRIPSEHGGFYRHVELWCSRVVREKNHSWHHVITLVLILHVALLCIGTCVSRKLWNTVRLPVSTAFMTLYMADTLIRISGESWTEYKRTAWNLYCSFTTSCAAAMGLLLLTVTSNHALSQVHMAMLLCVVAQLVTRNRYMDHMFRLAISTFTHIIDLLAVWLIMFLVYAIALNQTFGLTKSGDGSVNMSFRTVPKALSLLFRLSIGEGWGLIMEEFAHTLPPFCTVGERYFDGDCASPEWAYMLFISWNVISMYLFASMFISSAVESFSYIYENSSRSLRVEEADVQQFRDAWAELDCGATGFIPTEAFPKLLGRISGAFETRIHGANSNLQYLMALSRSSVEAEPSTHASSVPARPGIDLQKLRTLLDEIPIAQIREQRVRLNTLRHTVLASADAVHGIAFSSLLLLLVHHQLNNTEKHLGLHEFLQHNARLQRAEEASNREVITRFFETMYWSRKFQGSRCSARTLRNGTSESNVPVMSIWERFRGREVA